MAYLLFVLPIVGLLAIFGIALRGLGGQRDGFFLCQRKWLNLFPAADPANGQNAAIPIRLKTKHRPAVRIRP